MKNRNKLALILAFFGFILILSGSYALFSYTRTGNSLFILGDKIELTYTNENGFLLSNTFPMSAEKARTKTDNLFEFTVSGTNRSNKTLYYDINLVHGRETTTSKFWDYDIAFDLGYYNNNEMVYLLQDISVEKINHTTIYTDSIPGSSSSTTFSRDYFLRIWITDKAIISDSEGVGAHYRATSDGTGFLPVFKDCSSIINVEISGDLVEREERTNIYEYTKEDAVLDTNIDRTSNGSNGKFILRETASNSNPIYYFRGTTPNNFVAIGDTCWRIVRTTDTGGTKLVYYGEASEVEKKCINNYTPISVDGITNFRQSLNENSYSLMDISYMYGSNDLEKDLLYNVDLKNGSFYMSDSYFYNSIYNKYELSLPDLVDENSFNPDYYKYVLFLADETLEDVENGNDCIYRIISAYQTSTEYYLVVFRIGDGENEEQYMNKIFEPKYDSNFKKAIDKFYEQHLINYSNIFEDTVWCNDKTYNINTRYDEDENILTMDFVGRKFLSSSDPVVLSCSSKRDRYTVSNPSGNGKLKYPIGLLDKYEAVIINSNDIYGGSLVTMSPDYLYDMSLYNAKADSFGQRTATSASLYPSVSLKHDVYSISGDGSLNRPFIIQ